MDRNLVGDYLELKALHYVKNDVEKADDILKLGMKNDIDNTKTCTNAGLLLGRNLGFEEALAAFETLLRINPEDELALRKTSFWRKVLSSLEGVTEEQERALTLATGLFEGGRPDFSVGVLKSAVRAAPTSFKLCYNLAAVLISQQAFEEAADVLEKALTPKPHDEVAKRDLEKVKEILKKRGKMGK